MSCLQKVVHKMKHMHERRNNDFYIWGDGIGSQFRSRYIFKLLASKGPMDGIVETVKNVVPRKVKCGQLVVHSSLEVSENVRKNFPPIHSVYLPENKILSSQKI